MAVVVGASKVRTQVRGFLLWVRVLPVNSRCVASGTSVIRTRCVFGVCPPQAQVMFFLPTHAADFAIGQALGSFVG